LLQNVIATLTLASNITKIGIQKTAKLRQVECAKNAKVRGSTPQTESYLVAHCAFAHSNGFVIESEYSVIHRNHHNHLHHHNHHHHHHHNHHHHQQQQQYPLHSLTIGGSTS
jgi:G3E family GTPase